MKIYLIGSLRNPAVPGLASEMRSEGHDCFDDWYAAGPEADDCWQKYETERQHTYAKALEGHAAQHVFNFDKSHLDDSDACVLLLPAGKSGHLEFGYMVGKRKPSYILIEGDVKRYDVMYNFATSVFTSRADLFYALAQESLIAKQMTLCTELPF